MAMGNGHLFPPNGREYVGAYLPSLRDAARRGRISDWWRTTRSWPIVRPIAVQLALAGGLATIIAAALGHRSPVFAPLFAIVVIELLCSRHHRRAVEITFGICVGLLLGSILSPGWDGAHPLGDAAIGTVTAFTVALATTPRNPVAEVHRELDPLLTQLSTQARAIAAALRSNDVPAAGTAVYSLHETDKGLRQLDETLLHVRRAAVLTRWRRGEDLTAVTTTATEVGHAIRQVRSVARHAWWGLLRKGEPVPTALPQMLDALADGVAVLRVKIAHGEKLADARPPLICAGGWVGVMRAERLGLAAVAVAAGAEAAVLNLLVATGMALGAADSALRRSGAV
jgi:hypothetical protein